MVKTNSFQFIRSTTKSSCSRCSKHAPFIAPMLPDIITFDSTALMTAIISLYGNKPRSFYFVRSITKSSCSTCSKSAPLIALMSPKIITFNSMLLMTEIVSLYEL